MLNANEKVKRYKLIIGALYDVIAIHANTLASNNSRANVATFFFLTLLTSHTYNFGRIGLKWKGVYKAETCYELTIETYSCILLSVVWGEGDFYASFDYRV